MYFSVLGPLTVSTAAGRPVDIPEAKVRALLGVLLVHAGRTVSADRLVEDLWGDRPPRDPAGALQTKVSRLRRALARAEPGAEKLVESRAPGYALRVGPGDVDAGRFTETTATAYATDDPHTKAELLTRALALWQGDAFADLAGLDAVRSAAGQLEELRLTALETLAETRLTLGEHQALIGELGELSARHPLRERLRAVQLRALYQAGRQSEALALYDDVRRRLADELGADPGPELTALHQAILRHDTALRTAPADTPPSGHDDLPAHLTGLIGRTEAVSEIRRLLAAHRLVTLTGSGGVGKTRLAEEAARQAAAAFPHGVRMVALAGPTDVAEQLSAALGVREEGATGLEDALRPKRLLILLDNCEHVVESAARTVRRLLAAAPGLSVLATSREPLGVAGETVWTVPPLTQADAERLFTARAAAAAPGFTVTDEDAAAVATICRRLDRMPLALELAATRVRALGVREIAARLDDRFRLLAGGHRGVPPRQRTLRAVIDWSWELLADDERTLLRRLAVFTDGCTLDAAETVCGGTLEDGGDQDVLGPLIRLVDRSLVTVADGSRYRLPESIAAYALERLAEAGETDALHLRHHAYYTDLAEQAAAHLRGPGQRRRLALLDQERANLRSALERAVRRQDATGALRLALASTWYWFLRGSLSEARRSLEETLRLADGAEPRLRARARLWHAGFTVLTAERLTAERLTAGGNSRTVDTPDEAAASATDTGHARGIWFLGHALLSAGRNLPRSQTLVERALSLLRAAGDRWGTAAALGTRAGQALLRGDLATVRRSADEGHALFEELGDPWGQLQTGYPLAALAAITGDYPRAARLHREGLRLAEDLGFLTHAADRLTGLGRTALLTGDVGRADELHRKAMALAAEHGYSAGEIHAEIGLALAARREGDLDRAERHLRKTLAWHREVDFGPGPSLLLAELGFVAEQRGDATEALSLHRQSLAVARESGDPRAVALAYEGMAGAYVRLGQPARAARLLGIAARAREAAGAPLPKAERGDVDRITAAAAAALGMTAFTAEFQVAGEMVP